MAGRPRGGGGSNPRAGSARMRANDAFQDRKLRSIRNHSRPLEIVGRIRSAQGQGSVGGRRDFREHGSVRRSAGEVRGLPRDASSQSTGERLDRRRSVVGEDRSNRRGGVVFPADLARPRHLGFTHCRYSVLIPLQVFDSTPNTSVPRTVTKRSPLGFGSPFSSMLSFCASHQNANSTASFSALDRPHVERSRRIA